MKTIAVRYLESRKLADGSVAYYYNPPAAAREDGIVERQALGAELMAAIAAAEGLNKRLDAWRKDKKAGVQGPTLNPDSVKALFSTFRADRTYFLDKAPKTQRGYKQCMDAVEATVLKNGKMFGDLPFRLVEPRHADALYELLRFPNGPTGKERLSYANAMMRVCRLVWGWGKRQHNLAANPFEKPRMKATESRSVLWKPADVDAVMAAAISEGYPSMATAILLALELGQRIGDVRTIAWDHYEDGVFSFAQGKTGTEVVVPAGDALTTLLETATRKAGSPIVVCETTGEPYSEFLIRNVFARVRKAAGVSAELQLRDLRRTAITELSDAGATTDEMMAVSGHKTRAVLEVYSRKTAAKAQAAIAKRAARRRRLLEENGNGSVEGNRSAPGADRSPQVDAGDAGAN